VNPKSKSILSNTAIVLGLFLIFLFLLNPLELLDQTYFYIFQGRDIDRARLILQGKGVFFGPEMTGGGNLPGPLYYVLLAVGLLFKSNWLSSWWIQYVLAFVGSIFGAYAFRKSSPIVRLFCVALFATAPFTAWFLQVFLNVSSLIPFVAAALTFIWIAFIDEDSKRRNFAFMAGSLLIGIGLQFHLSILFLFAAMLYIQFFSKRIGVMPVPGEIFFKGLFLFFLPSIPYFVWLICAKFGIHFGKAAFYSGEADNALATNAFLIQNYLSAPFSKLLKSWMEKLLFTVPFPLVPLLITSLVATYKKKWTSIPDRRLKIILICLLFSLIPYLNWYISPQANRYTIPFYLCLVYVTLILFENLLSSENNFSLFLKIAIPFQILLWLVAAKIGSAIEFKSYLISNILVIIITYGLLHLFAKKIILMGLPAILSVLLVISINHVQKFVTPEILFSSRSAEGFMPTYSDWKKILLPIYARTGWSFDELKTKVYFIGHHNNQAPDLFLDAFKDKLPPVESPMSPDGFFVSNRFGVNSRSKKKNIYNWLLRQNLHKDVLSAIKAGDIKIGDNISDTNLIAPYWILKQTSLPRHFHNVGEGYNVSTEDLRLTEVQASEGIKKLSDSEYMFKWNESPDQDPYCSTGAFVRINKSSSNQTIIALRIIGTTISQRSPWISPNWTQAWLSPYLEVSCDDKIHKFIISSSIGFRREYSHLSRTPFFAGNNSIVAPFEKDFVVNCQRPVKHISLGRNNSEIEMLTSVKIIPGKVLTLKLPEVL
jgi:hypothetical protein